VQRQILSGESLIYKLRAQCLLRGSRRMDTDAVRGYESLDNGRRSDMRVPSPRRLLASTLPSLRGYPMPREGVG
jgi:hypothetical protein